MATLCSPEPLPALQEVYYTNAREPGICSPAAARLFNDNLYIQTAAGMGIGLSRLFKNRFGARRTAASDDEDDNPIEFRPLPAEQIDEIVAMYESGQPFFTKERIRSAWESAKAVGSCLGEQVLFQDFRGRDYTETAFEDPWGLYELDPVTHKRTRFPGIRYISVQQLLVPWVDTRDTAKIARAKPEDVYTNMRLSYDFAHPKSYSVGEVQKMDKTLGHAHQRWLTDQLNIELMRILDIITLPCRITKIVGFAFSTMEKDEYHHKNSLWQHALLMTLRDELGKRQPANEHIRAYVQDPAYTEADELALKKRDIEVVDDPNGFLHVDESTVVLSFSPNICVKQIVLDIARPAMIIWDRSRVITWEEFRDGQGCTDPETQRTKDQCKASYNHHELRRKVRHGIRTRDYLYDVWVRHA